VPDPKALPGEAWTTVPLGDVLELSSGDFIKATDYGTGTGRVTVVGAGGPIGTTNRSANTGTPAVVVGRVGAAGTPHFFPDAVFATDNTLIAVPGRSLRPRYLFHFLRSIDWHPLQSGSSQPLINQRTVKSLEIPLAPTYIQDSIAALIDDVESRRLSGQSHLTAARRAIERFRQAVFAAACSGRLTAEWREEHAELEPASELIDRTKLAAERAGQRIGKILARRPDYLDIPDSWEWAPLGWLAAIKGGIQKQPKRAPRNNAYPYLRVANVLRGRLDLSEIHKMELFPGELDAYRLELNDLLVIEGNGSLSEIGRSAIWTGEIENCVHQNHIIRVRCLETDPEYVNAFWNSPIGAREIADLAVTSAGLYNLSVGKVAAFPVPVPPLEEQREIIKRIAALMKMADELLGRISLVASTVERSSRSVLAKAFRGELIPIETAMAASEPGNQEPSKAGP
jgi:type I restriction enzyme, S subunit